jgi:hypothetical protein
LNWLVEITERKARPTVDLLPAESQREPLR